MRIGAKGTSKEQGLIRAKGRGEGYRVFSRSRGQQKVNRLSTEAVSLIGDLRCIDATLGGEGKGCVLCLIAGTHDGATDGGGDRVSQGALGCRGRNGEEDGKAERTLDRAGLFI